MSTTTGAGGLMGELADRVRSAFAQRLRRILEAARVEVRVIEVEPMSEGWHAVRLELRRASKGSANGT